MKTYRFFQLIRFQNLLIVAATQYILQYLLLIPTFNAADLSPTLPGIQFALLVLTTILIAAGGYIINDIVDYEIDLNNKPDKVIINRFISKDVAYKIYGFILLAGFIVSLYLAIYVGQFSLVLIYPCAFLLLWLYSHYLKRLPLWGNLIVAVFCAFVPGIVLFAERNVLAGLSFWLANEVQILAGGYILFAFSSTMLREIIKDLEDMAGDRISNCRTLPIAFGVKPAKFLAMAFASALLLLILILLALLFKNGQSFPFAFGFITVVLPLAFCIILLPKANVKRHYTRLSQLTKAIMVSGLLLLILIWKF